jgi:hypothetical protein
MPSSRPHSRRGLTLPDMRALTHLPVRLALSEEIVPVRRRDARAARRLVAEVKAMEMGSWIQRHRGQIRGALLGAGVLLVLTACAVAPPPDDPGGMSPAQGSSVIPRVPPSARVMTRYHEFFDATVVEYRAATSAQLTFLAYYTAHGRTPSGPPDTLHFGCVVHPESGHRGQEEGVRLIFWVEGQQVDMGELRFTPEPLAASYWLEEVPRQTVLPLLGAATLEGSCGGVPFQLSAAQWATFQAFVAGTAAERGR